MDELIKFRNMLIALYKKYETGISYVAIFLGAFFVFSGISTLSSGNFAISFVINVVFSVLSVFSSPVTFFLLILCACGIYLSFVSIEVALLSAVFVFLVLVFCVRLLPKESLLIPAMLIGFYIKIPFVVVLFGGIFMGLGALLPVGIATFVWHLIPAIPKFVELAPKESFTPLGMVNTLVEIYVEFVNYISIDKSWLYASLIFAAAIISCYIIPLFSIDYNREIAIATSSIVMLIGFITTIALGLVTNINIIFAIIGILLSVVIVWGLGFLDVALDYSGVERVQFEDDEYYYYVKAVPKYITDSTHDIPLTRAVADKPEKIGTRQTAQAKPITDVKNKMTEAYKMRAEKAKRKEAHERQLREKQSEMPRNYQNGNTQRPQNNRGYNFEDDDK